MRHKEEPECRNDHLLIGNNHDIVHSNGYCSKGYVYRNSNTIERKMNNISDTKIYNNIPVVALCTNLYKTLFYKKE